MNVSQRLLVHRVAYDGDGDLRIQVIEQIVNDSGHVIGLGAMPAEVASTEDRAIAIGAEKFGRQDGEWGNREIEALLMEQQTVFTPEIPAVPDTAEVKDRDGNVIRAGQAGRAAIPAVMRPRFPDVTSVVWTKDTAKAAAP